MQFIDKSGAQILPDCRNPAAKPDILTVRCVHRLFKCGVDAIGNKMKSRASAHVERCARVMGKHENRSVERRIVAPPSLPNVISPGPSDRSEHISTNNPRSDVVEAACDKVIVNTRGAAIRAMYLSKGTCAKDPFVQRHAPDAKWMIEILTGAGPVAIKRDRKADAKLGHKFKTSVTDVRINDVQINHARRRIRNRVSHFP